MSRSSSRAGVRGVASSLRRSSAKSWRNWPSPAQRGTTSRACRPIDSCKRKTRPVLRIAQAPGRLPTGAASPQKISRREDTSMLSELAQRDIGTLLHPYTNLSAVRRRGPLVFERGKGIYVYDTEGKAYIEGMSGLWCTALG